MYGVEHLLVSFVAFPAQLHALLLRKWRLVLSGKSNCSISESLVLLVCDWDYHLFGDFLKRVLKFMLYVIFVSRGGVLFKGRGVGSLSR